MTTVRIANGNDFDIVFPLFSGFATHTQVNPADWKKIFTHVWSGADDPIGYILEDEEKTVGFLGTIFSKRKINNQMHRFCNLTSWIVLPEYRNESLSLLFPLLGKKELTITNFTASNRVSDVLLKLGFKDLEQAFRIILPLPAPGKRIKLEMDLKKIRSQLDPENQKILDDHSDLHCTHVLMSDSISSCYLVLNPAVKKHQSVFYINYLSDLETFLDHYQAFSFEICRKMNQKGIMVGDHTLKGRSLPLTLGVRRKHSLLFRSNSVSPFDIDTLYSEIQLLGLKPV